MAQMKSNLTQVPLNEFEKQKRRWWQFWKSVKTHYKAAYEIRFQIQPAGIDFELWFKGAKYSDDSHFGVQWEEGVNIRSPKEHRRSSQDWSRRE